MLLDIFLLLVVVLAFFSGYKRGLIYLVAFLGGISLGIFISLSFSAEVTSFLESIFNIQPVWLPFISLVFSFGIVFLVVRYLSLGLKTILKTMNLNVVNKTLGGAVGSVIAFGLISIGYLHLSESNLITPEVSHNSRFYDICLNFAPQFLALFGALVPWIDNLFDSLEQIFELATNTATE